MTTKFPLQTVQELMQLRADDAAKALGRLIAAENDAKGRLSLLEGYRAEYAQRFQEAAGRGLSPQQWANFQEFSARIDEAIKQQQTIVDQSLQRTQDGQKRWLMQHQKVKVFDSLAQRHADTERVKTSRREQKVADELSARGRGAGDEPT